VLPPRLLFHMFDDDGSLFQTYLSSCGETQWGSLLSPFLVVGYDNYFMITIYYDTIILLAWVQRDDTVNV